MRSLKLTIVCVSTALLAGAVVPAMGDAYVQVIPGSELNPDGWSSFSQTGTVVEGSTAYAHYAKTNAPRDFAIRQTTGLGGALSTTSLATLSSWTADVGAPSSDRIFWGQGTEIVGNSIQIPDTSTSQVYRVDKTSGQVSVYVNNAAIAAAVGAGSATINSFSGVTNSGEAIFYESGSKQIVATTGADAASVLINTADLAASIPQSGLTFDAADNLYWGASGAGVYRRTSGGAISEILSQAELLNVLGGSGVGFSGDMFYAPDGLVYFRYGSSSNNQGIMSFNPSDPLSSLAVVLSRAELIAGPGGSSTTGPFAWYNGNLGWTIVGSPTGFYAIPEPASLTLLALGGVLLRRRVRV